MQKNGQLPAASPRVRKCYVRLASQAGFALVSVLTGWHFHNYIAALQQPYSTVTRPAAVDAWLPISSYTSLVYWLKSGVTNSVHPAGLVLFTLVLLLSLVFRRGFCSWVCPVGLLSEGLHRLGHRLAGRNLAMPYALDLILRALKYLLLLFFVVVIGMMSRTALRVFIYGDYNRICDLKMYALFMPPSLTTIIVVTVLAALSLVFQNFWCRYLCPYGALLGLFSALSPWAIRRNAASCIDCGRCTRVCPNRIDVAQQHVVRTAECTACLECVLVCPAKDTLHLELPRQRMALTPFFYAGVLLAAFIFVPLFFKALGYWESDTPRELYRHYATRLDELAHPPVNPQEH